MSNVTINNVQAGGNSGNQSLAALVNAFFPPIGYLIQGRITAFCVYLLILFCWLVFSLLTAGFGLLLYPVIWIGCVVETAKWKG